MFVGAEVGNMAKLDEGDRKMFHRTNGGPPVVDRENHPAHCCAAPAQATVKSIKRLARSTLRVTTSIFCPSSKRRFVRRPTNPAPAPSSW